MITGIHFLLTYTCTYECDHCFLYCSPYTEGTFTLTQMLKVFEEIKKIKTIKWVYFEGGEPFLYYPLLLEGIRKANELGLKTGVVTNGYWAKTFEDAKLWLKPLADLNISDLSISDDDFHNNTKNNPGKIAIQAAKDLKIPADTICIEKPEVLIKQSNDNIKGSPIIGGGVKFIGRAVEKLINGLPEKSRKNFTECPHENLENPGRVHIDAFGNVHICQGIIIGNMWKTPLSEIIKNYSSSDHPICAPLIEGGPSLLAEKYKINNPDNFIDECHFCYLTRKELIKKFPEFLGPEQVYGIKKSPKP